MAKCFPCHNFLAESLHRLMSACQHAELHSVFVAYTFDFIKVARRVYPQNFNGDIVILVLTLPHICVPAAIQLGI